MASDSPSKGMRLTSTTRGLSLSKWYALAILFIVFAFVAGNVVVELLGAQQGAASGGEGITAGKSDMAHLPDSTSKAGVDALGKREKKREKVRQVPGSRCELGVGLLPQKGRVACCGHRGSRLVAPENTIPSFHKALEAGANCVEMDVHLTLDRQLAVVHGGHMRQHMLPPTNAAAGKMEDQRRVEDMTWAEVRNLSTGAWFSSSSASLRVPLLVEVVLSLWNKDVLLILDLKIDPCSTAAGRLCPHPPEEQEEMFAAALVDFLTTNGHDTLRALKLRPPKTHTPLTLVLSSFHHSLVNRLFKRISEVPRPRPTMLLTRIAGLGYILHPRENVTGKGFLDDVRWLAPHFEKVNDPAVARLRKRHPRVTAWVSDDVAVHRDLVAMGVEAVITNDPTLCRNMCK